MYNLFVSSNPDSWDGAPWTKEAERCIKEYTTIGLQALYGEFRPDSNAYLTTLPCIFAYEYACHKDPLFGRITEIVHRQGKVRVKYEIIEIGPFLSYEDIEDLRFELDIGEWEMNRTHWALKSVELTKELEDRNLSFPAWCGRGSAINILDHKFDVALSFPGEKREYVREVVKELERLIGPNKYFYDQNHTAQLARPNLDTHWRQLSAARP